LIWSCDAENEDPDEDKARTSINAFVKECSPTSAAIPSKPHAAISSVVRRQDLAGVIAVFAE
jgi:hypothetical protein